MLATVLGNLADLAQALIGVMTRVVQMWPVAVMAAFLIFGVGTGYIKRLVNARRGKRRRS